MSLIGVKSIERKLFSSKTLFKSLNDLFFVKMTSNSPQNNDNKSGQNKTIKELPQPPENCCQSGCDNCVWIKYVDELEELYKDGGEEAYKQLDKLMNDPSLKVFIKLQITNKSEDN